MNNYIGYIYKTTNLINNKIYIGQHQKNVFDDNYFGSGRVINNALKKYGRNSFKVEILCWKETIEGLNKAEIYFIAAFNSTNKKIGYNISFGGDMFVKGLVYTEDHKLIYL